MSGSDPDDGALVGLAKRLSLYPTSEAEREAVIAGGASLVVPGAGQWYNGQPKRGAVLLAIAVALLVSYLTIGDVAFLVGIFIEPLLRLVAAYDAFTKSGTRFD